MAWETTEILFPLHGDFTTHSITEFRKDGPVCVFYATTEDTQRGRSYLTFTTGEAPRQIIKTYLRDVLEPWTERLRKYLLSAKACQGILNRAMSRGKKLPEILEQALIRQSVLLSAEKKKAAEECSPTLNAGKQMAVVYDETQITSLINRSNPHPGDPCHTLHTGNRSLLIQVFDARGNGDGETAPTITGDHNGHISDYTALCVGNGQMCNISMAPVANSLNCMHEDSETYLMQNSLVRRLTPDENASLQGFPRNWCNIGDWIDSKGKKHRDSDAVKYRAFGNSLALPFWQWLAYKISEQYDRPVEIASLFGGIGGFPLVFTRAGGRAVWASEIEEFPIAVTKLRFPE